MQLIQDINYITKRVAQGTRERMRYANKLISFLVFITMCRRAKTDGQTDTASDTGHICQGRGKRKNATV